MLPLEEHSHNNHLLLYSLKSRLEVGSLRVYNGFSLLSDNVY